MERDGADNCLPPRLRSPDRDPNGDLWWQCRSGELYANGCKDFPNDPQELKIETIQGKPLGRGHIKYGSSPVTLQVGCFQCETISFLVLEGPTIDIILGRPWLLQHSQEVRWGSSEILRLSESCFQNCISIVPVLPSILQVNFTLVESPEPLKKHVIPSDFAAFQDVFSKQAAT